MFSSRDPSSPPSSQKSSLDSTCDKNEKEPVSNILKHKNFNLPSPLSSKISSSPTSLCDSTLNKNGDETVSDVPEKFHPLSPLSSEISNSPRSLFDSSLHKNGDKTVSDVPEKFYRLSPLSSKISSSPTYLFDSTLNKNGDETVSDVPKKFHPLSPLSSKISNTPRSLFDSSLDKNGDKTVSDVPEKIYRLSPLSCKISSCPRSLFDSTLDKNGDETVSDVPEKFHPLSPPSSKISSSPSSLFDSILDKNGDETVSDVPEKIYRLSPLSCKISSCPRSLFDSTLDKNGDETVSDVPEKFHPLSPLSSKISNTPRSLFDSSLDKNGDKTVSDVPEKIYRLSPLSCKISSCPRSLFDSTLDKNGDETVSDVPEKFHPLSPPSSKISSSPSSLFDSILDKNGDETVSDVPEKFHPLSPPSSNKTYLASYPNSSFHSTFDMNKNETSSDVSENSSPLSSPSCSLDSMSDMDENEIISRAPKKYLSLPYFYLPNPNLEEFLIETEKNLRTPETQTKAPGFPRRIFEPKDKGDIVFTVGTNTLKDNDKISGNAANCSDYQRMLASLAKLDDSKSPGIKRLVLKDYLKKKIEEKKALAFERAKELAEIDKEKELENEEEIVLESESSEDEDTEEATVSFDEKEKTEDDKLNDFCTDSLELSKYSDNINNDDDEGDDFAVRKARKVYVLEDDSSGESCVGDDRSDSAKHHLAEDMQLKCKSKASEDAQINENITNHRKNNFEVDLRLFTDLPVYSSDASNISNCSDKDDFQVISVKELSEDSHDFIEALDEDIMASIPSYQPGGGFRQQEGVELDCSGTVTPGMQTHDKYLFTGHSDSRSTTPNSEKTPSNFKYSSTFGLNLNHPPVSQQGNMSGLFSSQDLNDICSGVFKAESPQETRFQKKTDKKCEFMIKSPQEKVQDYFDVEAELSGDDDVSDEDEDVDCVEADNDLDLVNDHELPSAEELRDEIADLHMKRMRDDDDELLKEIQEKFLDDGELNTDIDGSRRTRKYTWINSNAESAIVNDRSSSSESDDDALDETLCSMNKEKVKWLQEKAESDFAEELCFENKASKKPHLKIHIIGKHELDNGKGKSSEHLFCKRSRGSFLHMDGNESSHMLKRLKPSEDIFSGSRTTKHFLFRNEDMAKATEGASRDAGHVSGSGSVFNVI